MSTPHRDEDGSPLIQVSELWQIEEHGEPIRYQMLVTLGGTIQGYEDLWFATSAEAMADALNHVKRIYREGA